MSHVCSCGRPRLMADVSTLTVTARMLGPRPQRPRNGSSARIGRDLKPHATAAQGRRTEFFGRDLNPPETFLLSSAVRGRDEDAPLKAIGFGLSVFYKPESLPAPLKIEARGNTRRESAKVRSRRLQKKYNGSPTKPRLSVFCSTRELYAMLVDDQNKKTLFYASTLQKSIRKDSICSTAEAAQRVGEELIKACKDLNICEISSYDRNGFARGERMAAFEISIAEHGFLPR